MLKKVFGWIVNRWTISILGLLLLAVLIWVFGPAFAFAGHVPLATEAARWITIAVIVLAWLAYQVVVIVRQRRNNAKMLDSLTKAPAVEDPQAVAAREEQESLTERFREALATLKTTKLGGGYSRRQLYQLPWYLMIGPPGSGKTTALVNSGLSFPLAESFGKAAVRGIGGTRNCDWFFTDEAVLIDTAGRYTTQDSDETVDRAAWQGFLDLLRKHRPRRPIDGVIVAFSVTELIARDASARQQHAQAVRRRIREVYASLQLRVPVYVILTKCDLVAGFREFFGTMTAEERGQVWGTTFAAEQSRSPAQVLAAFPPAYDQLMERLTARQLVRMEDARDISERGMILSYPQQMALLKAPIEAFLTEAFQPSKLEEPCFLRGIYLTSATQEGSPIDRVLAAVATSFGIERQAMPPFSGRGISFFLTRLLRDVVFKEAALVTSTSWIERHRVPLSWAAYAGAGVLTLALIGLLFMSYSGNRAWVAEADRAADEIKSTEGEALYGRAGLEGTLAALNALRDLPGGHKERRQGLPFTVTVGLDQTEKLGNAAETAYRQALNLLLLPRLMGRMEQQIAGSLGRTDYLYQALKAYLMVVTPEQRDADLLRAWLARDWGGVLPGAANAALREDLDGHVQALFEEELTPPPAGNTALIAEARQALLRLPLASRVYTQLRTEQGAERTDGWTLAAAVPPDHVRFFARRSGKPLTEGIARLYTIEGYKDVFIRQRSILVSEVVEDTWVLGPEYARLKGGDARKDLERNVEELYFADYIRVWDAFIRDLIVTPVHSTEQLADMVRAFAQPDSPIKSVLSAIAGQTGLARALAALTIGDTTAPGELKRIQERIERWIRPGSVGQGPAPAAADPAQRVDRQFAAIYDLVKTEGTAPPRIDGVLAQLNGLHEFLLFELQARAQALSPPDRVARGRAEVVRIRTLANPQPEPLKSWLLSLVTTTEGSTVMPAVAGARRQVQDAWSSGVAPQCQAALAGRYPLVRSATVDANLDDFVRVLGPNGLIDKFAQEHVLPFADKSVRPWRWRPGPAGESGLSAGALRLFEQAARIREAFFAGGSGPFGVAFEVEPLTLDNRARQVVLEIGDQRIVYQHGPRQPRRVQWPPAAGSGARVTFTPIEQIGQTLTLSKGGPWALFHLLDAAQMQRSSGVDRFRFTVNVQGYQAQFELRAFSVINPFALPELERFQCPDRL
ncbi:MAG: type VI secretion system membrane subunit TssM [Defluviicoccus sp.]